VQAKEDLGCVGSQNWWIQTVSPLRGDTWVDGYRTPGETNLLFAFPDEARLTVEDRWQIEPEPPEWLLTHAMLMPQRWLIRQQAPGDVLQAGQSLHFSTVLLPHPATELPEPLAQGVRFLVNRFAAGAIRLERGGLRTFLAMGDALKRQAEVRSDADLLALVLREGATLSLFARNATGVQVIGVTLRLC
jgi:hypothetical protein